jgi:hypothetical protein
MWWLSFVGGGGLIVEAVSLAQARLLAVAKGPGRPSQFAEGHSIRPNLAALLPDGSVGRMLTPVEARRLLKLMRYGPHIPEHAAPGRGTN